MNDQEMKRLLQSAIDHRLSGLQENPFLARRIIAAAKGELPMKKKLSVSLILVLVLYLGNEIVDGVMLSDNISQLTHIIGGICGAVLGLRRR